MNVATGHAQLYSLNINIICDGSESELLQSTFVTWLLWLTTVTSSSNSSERSMAVPGGLRASIDEMKS